MTNTSGARRGIGILRSGKAEIRNISERATPDELWSAECGMIESNPRRGVRVASSFAKDSAGQVLANNPARGGCVACDAGKRSRTYRGKSSPRSSMLSIFRTHCEKQLCVGRTLITSPIRVILLLDRKHPTQPRSPWVGQTSQRLAVSKRDERSGLNERPSG